MKTTVFEIIFMAFFASGIILYLMLGDHIFYFQEKKIFKGLLFRKKNNEVEKEQLTDQPEKEDLHQKITWQQLQNFIETLTPEQKTKHIPVCFQDESAARYLLEPFKMETDIYVYDNEPEDSGSLELLKQIKEDEDVIFDISKCELVCKKGTPFLWLE